MKRKLPPSTSSYTLHQPIPLNNTTSLFRETSPIFRKALIKDLLLSKTQNIRKRPLKMKMASNLTLCDLVTSSSWILYDSETNTTYGHRINAEKEIASLTKIMTCIIVLEQSQKYKLDKNVKVKVNKTSTRVGGTTANLVEDSWMCLSDLVYGLMLPSGNDAAWLLAEVFGLLMYYEKYKSKQTLYQDIESIDVSTYEITDHFISYFLKSMNKKAKLLGMMNTNFSNPHGLNNPTNYSSAKDILTLCKFCLKNQQFVEIVSTKSYISLIESNEQEYELEWKNTNKLLQQGWMGIKTGQTSSAGACLASYKKQVLIVVLNSNSGQKRFEDTIQIYDNYQKWKSEKSSQLIQDN